MPEENKTGTEQAGGADQDKAGNNDAAAGVQQGDTQDAAGNQEVEGLKAAAVAEREKRQAAVAEAQAAKAEAQSLRDQMAIVSAQPAQQQERVGLYKAVVKQLGINPEYATPDEQGQIFEGMVQVTAGQQSEQSFIISHPDYGEVVGVNGPGGQFQYAPPLIRALKANPALANALNNSPNKAVLAYSIASKDPQYLAEQAEKSKSPDVKKGEEAAAKIAAANKQLSVSNAKGGRGTLDNAARRAAQTDEEFRKENEEIMAKAT